MSPLLPKKSKASDAHLTYVANRFEGVERNCSGYRAICPVHDDVNPSLSINKGTDGGVVVHCHAGCPIEPVLEVVGLRTADLMPGAKRIVAEYNYTDARGNLLYQNVRYEPKAFRVRRPIREGGWEWNLEGVERVLYNLPAVSKAKKKRIWYVAGEKDADRLSSLGLCATTNINGEKAPWRSSWGEPLREKDVVILPDDDATGRARAFEIAEHLQGIARSVKIAELPGLPEHGDVSDWLDQGHTKKELIALANVAPEVSTLSTRRRDDVSYTDVHDPSSRRPVGAVEDFPIQALPKPLQKLARSIAAALPCPVDFPGAMILPILGALIGRKRRIALKASWAEFPLLWVAVVARSGDRKTPAFQIVTDYLRKKQRELYEQYLDALAAYENGEIDTPPVLRQILTTDSTVEALHDVLASNPDGVIFPSDELGAWARGIGQYKGGGGSDRQVWLSIWSSTQVIVNRRSRGSEPLILNDPFVSLVGGIQPDALEDVIDDGREDGFAARLLFSYPNPIADQRWTDKAVDGLEAYGRICESLWLLKFRKKPIELSPRAKARWIEWVNDHRAEIPPDNLRPTWAKCEGHCARIALILFVTKRAAGETKASAIDLASMNGAIDLINYFKSHTKRVYGFAADRTDKGRIGNALKWVRKMGHKATARNAHRYGLVKDTDAAIALFNDLKALGHGDWTEEARGSIVFRLADSTLDDTTDED